MEERVRPLEDATRVIDFTIHDAYTGIINELIDYSYYIVKGIHDRYSTRVMTANTFEILSSLIPKRKTKVIGFREIKWMEMELTGPIIATSIAIQAEENFLSKSNEELSGKIRATPSHDLPWYNLIRTLYLAGRLNDYLRWQYSLTGLRSPPGHLTHDNVTGFIGVSSLQIMTRNMTTPPLVILSYYDRVAIGQQVKKMAYMQRWKILRNHYLQDLDIRHTLRTGTYYTLATPLLEEAILLSCITVDKAAYDEYILETLQGGNTGEVQILTTEFMDLEDIPQTVEEARNISSCLNYLIDKFQDFDWPSMLDNVFNRFQDIIEKTEPLLRNSTMRVVYSTVTTCINEIRAMLARDESASSDTDEANRQKELTDNWQESQDRIRYRGVKLKPCDLNIRTGQRADQHPTVRYNVNYEPTERVILNTASMGCIYGTTTRGGSKLLEIMSRLNIDVPIDSYQCFATLGEGTGGFLQMLASLSESCLFVYCSLREGEDKDVLSIQAKDTILMNSHVCFTDHIINGFDDLTYPETMHQLEKYQLKYAMVTLDAENVNDSNRLSVLHNSITFYLRNTTDTGIFICKIYLREVFINGYAIQYLQEFCKVVQVLRLHASRPNDEHYIVAYGRGQFDTIPEYGLRNDFISQPLMDSLALFTHRFITAYNEIKDQKYTTINLYHQYDRYLRRCHNYQEYYVVGLLQRQLGLSLTNQDLIYIFNIVMTEQSLYSARSLINDEYESLFFTHIWNMDKPFLKNQPFDNNTFRGIISLAHRWLILRGYKRFLELVATLQAGSRVNLTTVWTRQVYLEEVSKLPARTQLANSSKRMFYTTCKIKRVTTQGYFSLIRGIDIGILLLSTWRYHKYQR